MRFHLIHVDSEPRADAGEEAYVVTPGTARTAIAVPIDALPDFLPILSEALEDLPGQRCPCCGEAIATPALAAMGDGG